MATLDLKGKLAILADAAKYDASCASSGGDQARFQGQQGHRLDRGLGHLPCLRARRPLHLAAQDPADQLLHLRLRLLRQPQLQQRPRAPASRSRRWSTSRCASTGATISRACSCPRASSARPTTPWSSWSGWRALLRQEHGFRGYIHLKTIPEASPALIDRGRALRRPAVDQHRAADRGGPRAAGAREARRRPSARRMGQLRLRIEDAAGERQASREAPRFAPAGQSTQMIVGADEARDDRRS